MSQVQISPDIALRETLIESEQRRNRVMVLAQQLAEAQRENVLLKDRLTELAAEKERDDLEAKAAGEREGMRDA